MQWVGFAELAAAVSNAGGLGIVRSYEMYPHGAKWTNRWLTNT